MKYTKCLVFNIVLVITSEFYCFDMYFIPVKKITKIFFDRRSLVTKRERRPLALNECLDSTAPNPRSKYCMRLFTIFITMSAFFYYMLCHGAPSQMSVQNLQMTSKKDDDVTIEVHDIKNNVSFGWYSQVISNISDIGKRLINAEIVKKDSLVITEHMWKTKIEEVRLHRKIDDNLATCVLNVSSAGNVTINKEVNLATLQIQYPMLKTGGYYRPEGCRSRHKVAILVPYRDREANLALFLSNIHPFLMRQQLEYRIIIIEQAGNENFNRGRLFNVGFKEMKKFNDWHCVVFHDVDLLPLNHKILYTCPTFPRHMCGTVAEKENLTYNEYHTLFGGVTAMSVRDFERINGYSNLYWGWGGEDNDLFWRIRKSKLPTVRYDKRIARYTMLPHSKQPRNHNRYKLLRFTMDTHLSNGLSNLVYRVISRTLRHLYTRLLVDINPLKENTTHILEIA